MATSTNGYTESTIYVGDTGVTLLRGGPGRPPLVFHEELGHPGWCSRKAALWRTTVGRHCSDQEHLHSHRRCKNAPCRCHCPAILLVDQDDCKVLPHGNCLNQDYQD